MNMKPEKKDFTLKKLKVKAGVVHIEAEAQFSEKNIVHTQKINDDFTFVPHEDMTSQLEELKYPLAKVHGLLNAQIVITASDFKATAAQKKIAEISSASALMDTSVTGIALSGSDQNRGCVITGVYDGQAINSKRIKFIGTGLGFEDKVQEAADKLIDEVYEYLYLEKRGEVEVLTDANQTIIIGAEDIEEPVEVES